MLEHRICSVSIIVSRYCRLCIIQILAYVFGIAKFLNLLFYGFFFICGEVKNSFCWSLIWMNSSNSM